MIDYDEFNSNCAIALGCGQLDDGTFATGEGCIPIRLCLDPYIHPVSMKFHISYDWAYLLLAKLTWIQLHRYQKALYKRIGETRSVGYPQGECPVELFQPSARQISQACLEVLNNG